MIRYAIVALVFLLTSPAADAGPILRHVREHHNARTLHRLTNRDAHRHHAASAVVGVTITSVTSSQSVTPCPPTVPPAVPPKTPKK